MLFKVEAEVKVWDGDAVWIEMMPGMEIYAIVSTDVIDIGHRAIYAWWDLNLDHPVIFSSYREYEVWRRLSKVSGIGPLLSARILRVLGVEGLVQVLASGDVSSLVRIRGVGPKLAKRVVSELADMVSSKLKLGDYEDIVDAFAKWGFEREKVKDVLGKMLESGEKNIDDLLADVLRELAGGDGDDSTR